MSLLDTQIKFLKAFLIEAGVDAIGKKFDLIHANDRKYARYNGIEIAINLTDRELLDLARSGYLEIHNFPPSITFTSKVQTIAPKPTDEFSKTSNSNQGTKIDPVLKLDIVQVYAWLVACLIAAAFSLWMVWLTIQHILAQNAPESIGTVIVTLISSVSSAIFFRNYDKANENLKHLRSQTNDDTDRPKQLHEDDEDIME